MVYSYKRQDEVNQIISSCRPESAGLDFWAKQIKIRLSTEGLDQHRLYLTSRLNELMNETVGAELSINGAEHSLDLAKIAEITSYLDAVEIALGKK